MIIYLAHIFIPLVFSNVLHMLVVKWNWFPYLKKPISSFLFGANKTWRGLIVVPLLNGFFFLLLSRAIPKFESIESFVYGLLFGLVYIVFELPNSILKRYAGIDAGEKSKNHPVLFSFLDKSDSALGVTLLSKLLFNFSWIESFLLLVGSITLHALISSLLVLCGVKRNF